MFFTLFTILGAIPEAAAGQWARQPPFPEASSIAWRGDHWPDRNTWEANSGADASTGDIKAYLFSYIDLGGYLNVHFKGVVCDYVYVTQNGILSVDAVFSLYGHAYLFGLCVGVGQFTTGWSIEVWLVIDDLDTGSNILDLPVYTWQDSDYGEMGDLVDRGTDFNSDYVIPEVSIPVQQKHVYRVTVEFLGWAGVTATGVAAAQSMVGEDFQSKPFQLRLKWLTYDGPGMSIDRGSGGYCPFVSIWNGTNFALDNNVLPTSELKKGIDVEDYYRLEQMPVPKNGKYSLLLSEFEGKHDFFDMAQLLAVDHLASVSVAVSSEGQVFTYVNPQPPVSAITNEHENVKHPLSSVDEAYYQGYDGSYVDLNFGDEVDVCQGARLVLRTDMKCADVCIKVQVQENEGNWSTVAVSTPRRFWSTDIIDMSEHLPDAEGNLKIRLSFTANHKVDFVGLDTSPQTTIYVHQGQLVSAWHNMQGDVTNLLLHNDGAYAEIIPGQQIQLEFSLPNNTEQARTFILYTKGCYYTIP